MYKLYVLVSTHTGDTAAAAMSAHEQLHIVGCVGVKYKYNNSRSGDHVATSGGSRSSNSDSTATTGLEDSQVSSQMAVIDSSSTCAEICHVCIAHTHRRQQLAFELLRRVTAHAAETLLPSLCQWDLTVLTQMSAARYIRDINTNTY